MLCLEVDPALSMDSSVRFSDIICDEIVILNSWIQPAEIKRDNEKSVIKQPKKTSRQISAGNDIRSETAVPSTGCQNENNHHGCA